MEKLYLKYQKQLFELTIEQVRNINQLIDKKEKIPVGYQRLSWRMCEIISGLPADHEEYEIHSLNPRLQAPSQDEYYQQKNREYVCDANRWGEESIYQRVERHFKNIFITQYLIRTDFAWQKEKSVSWGANSDEAYAAFCRDHEELKNKFTAIVTDWFEKNINKLWCEFAVYKHLLPEHSQKNAGISGWFQSGTIFMPKMPVDTDQEKKPNRNEINTIGAKSAKIKDEREIELSEIPF